MQLSTLLTKEEAAELLHVSTRTLDRYRQTHDVGEVRLTGVPRYRRSTIEAAIVQGYFNKNLCPRRKNSCWRA